MTSAIAGRATATLPSSPFWRFSLELYAQPGVAPACLALQDRHGADVNLILLALWLGTRGHRLDTAAGRRLSELARAWQSPLVMPLRRVRRRLKQRQGALPWPAAVDGWRGRLAAVELALEQAEQLLLEAESGEHSIGSADEGAALHNLGALGLAPLANTTEAAQLLRAAFHDHARAS